MTPSGTTTPGTDTTAFTAAPTPPPATPPSPPAPPSGDGAGAGDGWTPPPAPERSGGLLGRLTVGLVLVTVGLLWSLRLAGVLAITGGQLLAAALLVVGLGLLVGSIAGRARGLIWLGALLLPLVLIAQIPTPGWIQTFPSITTESGAAGEVRVTPTELDELQDSYELGAGSIRIDLRELLVDGEDIELELSVGVGEIEVLVPDDLDLEATASIGIGEIQLLDRSSGGIGVGDVEVRSEAAGVARGSVQLELSAGIGEIDVRQVEATP
jgi:predicted membrane protein